MGINIKFKNIFKDYEGHIALNNLNFEIEENDIVGIVGPSGSGKTSLINLLLFDNNYNGQILFNNEIINKKLKEKYKISVVFDTPMCLEHLNVFDNIQLGLKQLKLDDKQINKNISDISKLLEIDDKLNCYPSQLSLGQKQRVAIARALCRNCDLLLMDEPFSNLDIVLKFKLLKVIKKLQKEMNFTCIFVTHDLNETKNVVDKLMILDSCKVQCYSTFDDVMNNCDNKIIKCYKQEDGL